MSIITYSMKKDWNKKLSKNFCAYEFACNDRSDEFKVATELVETLQQIRDHFGKPVLISSAYRTPAYNISIGGSSRSQHCLGTAADIHINGVDPIRIALYVASLPYFQKHGGIGYYSRAQVTGGFVHVDVRETHSRWVSKSGTAYQVVSKIMPTIRQGSKDCVSGVSYAVTVLQRHLGLKVDGIFGAGTKAKLVEWQKAHGFEFSRLRIDCVEWRVDWFEQCMDAHSVVSCLQKLRVALKDKLLLVTFRTKAEGGEVSLTHKEYLDFINTVIDTDCADLIDIEFFTAGDDVRELVDNAHSSGVVVICSSHDFQKTPNKNELISRMVKMQQVGADLPKVAVMPHDSTDVLTLLAATVEMKNKYFATPIITISMSKLGVASRLCGEVFGSAMTFASAGDSSAPGQIGLDVVNAVLDSIAE